MKLEKVKRIEWVFLSFLPRWCVGWEMHELGWGYTPKNNKWVFHLWNPLFSIGIINQSIRSFWRKQQIQKKKNCFFWYEYLCQCKKHLTEEPKQRTFDDCKMKNIKYLDTSSKRENIEGWTEIGISCTPSLELCGIISEFIRQFIYCLYLKMKVEVGVRY